MLDASWGEGTVGQVDADTVTGAFEMLGYRTLARAVVDEDPDVLRPLWSTA